ncbi:MAG: metallopeptidase TldD-related protein [bacterium]
MADAEDLQVSRMLDGADALAGRVASFIDQVADDADQVELWACQERRRGVRLGDDGPLEPDRQGVGIRVWRDGLLGEAAVDSLDPADWHRGIAAALASLAPTDIPPPPPPTARRPAPSVMDPALPEVLDQQDLLVRLPQALVDNVRHEAERIPGLGHVDGRVEYLARHRVVGNTGGVLTETLGELRCVVELDGRFGECVRVIHVPDSFLHFALMGARSWRTMPRVAADPLPGLRERMDVMLHPRVLEALLRRGLADLLTEGEAVGGPRFPEGELIADPAVTLVDDPGLDGLARSRAFDDEGTATRRTALLIRGRMTQHLRGRVAAERTGRPATGAMARRGRAGLAPYQAAPTPAFSCLLMERGQPQFHDLVEDSSQLIVVHALGGDLAVDPVTTAFSVTIRWGTLLEAGVAPRVLAAGRWRLTGHLLSLASHDGLLNEIVPSRDALDTGTGILPYARAPLWVEAIEP